ncbi:MAG TPA: protein kinase [Gemmataceae bacterium]|nr:protein kinase [Gemmataceae bacterium]
MTARQQTATPSVDDYIGATIGDFRLLRKLGQGGMGQVFLAEQISLKRNVAIKMLRDDIANNAVSLARFQAEATTIAKLNHPNVVQAYLVGEHEGRWYLAMEYVEGVSLREYMERNAPLDVRLVLSIMRQVASALDRAGELGIVHRDIKPENILITRKALAKVADFGLARCLDAEERIDLTRAGAAVGTPLYMSPEQIEGKELDGRSDIYSFGVTCYQMLSGTLPFTGMTAFEVATKHVREVPPDLLTMRTGLPAPLCAVVHKMLAKNPAERHATARELVQDVARVKQAIVGGTQTITITDTPADPQPASTAFQASPARPAVDVPREPGTSGKGGSRETTDEPRQVSRASKSNKKSNESAPAVPSKRWIFILALGGGATILAGIVGVLVLAVGLAWWGASAPDQADQRPQPVEVKPPAEPAKEAALAALKQSVDLHLKDNSPRPGGVDDCIDLAVHYLREDKIADAEALFKRMCERKPPSAYYFTGKLGLAVTDAMHHNHVGAKAKLAEVFDSKARDKRVQMVKDVQDRKPDFAEWVNETKAWVQASETAVAVKGPAAPNSKGFRPFGKMQFPRK